MKIALATAHSRRDLHEDDQLLVAAFAAQGVEAVPLVWTEPAPLAEFSAVIVRSCWDHSGDPAAFMQWAESVEAHGVPLLNSARTIRWNHHKFYLRSLSRLGLPTVPTIFLPAGTQPAEVKAAVRAKDWHDVLITPATGNSTDGIRRLDCWHDDGQLEEELEHEFPSGSLPASLVQPFIPSVQTEGKWSFVGFDRQLSHCLRKWQKPGDVRAQIYQVAEPCDEGRNLAQAVLQLIPAHLFARINLLRCAGQLVVSEVEMIDPFLNFAAVPGAATRCAEVVLTHLRWPPRVTAAPVRPHRVSRQLRRQAFGSVI